jgi:hypothetical protein
MKGLYLMLDILKRKHEMTDEEKDTLLSELMGAYAGKSPCYLMDLIIKGDMQGFRDKVQYMIEKGLSLEECIQSNLDSP